MNKPINGIIKELGGREKLAVALKDNLSWIRKSFLVHDDKGSAASRSVIGKWEEPYLETTGYLLPTLVTAAEYYEDETYLELARKQVALFLGLQNENGSFPRVPSSEEPIVFDTAQILIGLMSMVPHMSASKEILASVKRCKVWLQAELDYIGLFPNHNFVKDYNPAYYARVAWALVAAENIFESKPTNGAKALIGRISELQNKNLSYQDWGLHPEAPGLTHTIAYTLRGLWECATITNSRPLKKEVTLSMVHLTKRILKDGKLAASYDQEWKGDFSYVCSTGNAQLALLYLLAYKHSGYKKFLEPIPLLLSPLLKAQRTASMNVGAIPSSIPVWGPYQKMKFTNWTQKFYSDVLLQLLMT